MNLPKLGANNPVAANLLMLLIVVAGVYQSTVMLKEIVPSAAPEKIRIRVEHPGVSPEELEKLVALRIEREVRALQGVKEVRSLLYEGLAVLELQLDKGKDRKEALDDVRAAVDRVRPDLPAAARPPVVSAVRPRLPVAALVFYGDVPPELLRPLVKRARDELLAQPGVSSVLESGIREREIRIAILPEHLARHGLTFAEVGRALAAMNLDVPAGELKGGAGNIRLRAIGEETRAEALEQLVIRARPDGSAIRLGELGRVEHTFVESALHGRFRGRPAGALTIYKTPEEDAIAIAKAMRRYAAAHPQLLGGAVKVELVTDLARFIEERVDLVVVNACQGFVLVVITLVLMLELGVAFWVAAGLPVALAGTLVLMHAAGATINMLSLLGLVVVLGMLVDDAIVIGENVFTLRRAGLAPVEAAVQGASEMALPLLAAVTTTMVAFLPMAFIGGQIGSWFGVLPVVVIAALSVSLVEALFILPAHLAHPGKPRIAPSSGFFAHLGEARIRLFETTLPAIMGRANRLFLECRYAVCLMALACLAGALILVAAGVVPFVLYQELDAEILTATIEMEPGTSELRTLATIKALERHAAALPEVQSVFSTVGSAFGRDGERVDSPDAATVGQLVIELLGSERRQREGLRSSAQVLAELRRRARSIEGALRLVFEAQSGVSPGSEIEIRLKAEDPHALEAARRHVRAILGSHPAIGEVNDSTRRGKTEVRLVLGEQGRALGLDTRALGEELRHAVFGFEVQELQLGEDKLKVRLILPEAARARIGDLERLEVTTPARKRVALGEVARLERATGHGALERVDGKRAVTIIAAVDRVRGNVELVTRELERRLADVGTRYDGVQATFEGEGKETRESLGSLAVGFPAALFLIYAILAVVFRSYWQPLIIMTIIPFSLTGAVAGHLLLGYPFTLLSVIGCVALAGVVVNDSLVLIHAINQQRAGGKAPFAAALEASCSRFRAIVLTSVTTIAGLAPLMFERSFQAQFLIPLAISLAFGLAFATLLTLVLVPALYLVLADLGDLLAAGKRRASPGGES